MSKNKAFSLIEVAVVVLIMGILIAGITTYSSLIQKFSLLTAASITKSSPVLGIYGLEAWYETSLSESFKSDEASNGSYITQWRDINPNSTSSILAKPNAPSNRPKYIEGALVGLPAVRFDGVDDFLIASGLSIISKQITVFMVAKRRAVSYTTAGLSFVPSSALRDYDNDKSFAAFYESVDGKILQTYSNKVLSTASHPGTGIAYIVETVFDGTKNTLYLNGIASPSVNTSSVLEINKIYMGVRVLTAAEAAYIGYYNGDIAEIIVFSRVLKTEDRKLVEKYLSKKYSIKIS